MRIESTQLAKEGKVLLGVLLGVLSHHEDQLEVVHAEGDVVERVDIREEDDVLDCLLDNVGVGCLQVQENAQARLVVWWLLADVGGENGLDVFNEVALKECSQRVADRVDLISRDGTGGSARGIGGSPTVGQGHERGPGTGVATSRWNCLSAGALM